MSGIYDEINSKRFSEKDDYELSPKEIHARAIAKRGLLEEDQVRTALDADENPIDLSLKKWIKIQQVVANHPTAGTVMGLNGYIGYRTCALCIVSIKAFKDQFGDLKDDASKCTVCPLAELESCVTKGSAYSQIDDAITSVTYGSGSAERDAKLVEIVQVNIAKLLANLERLKQSVS